MKQGVKTTVKSAPQQQKLKLYGFANDFYYAKFTKSQQVLITQVINGLTFMKPEIVLQAKLKLTLADYKLVRKFIMYEVPELYMCELGAFVAKPYITKIVLVYTVNSIQIQNDILQKCTTLIQSSRMNPSNLAWEYLEFISKHSKYGNVAEKNVRHPQFNPTGPFQGVAVCAGYAKLFKLLCKMLNKPAICVTGPASNGENHAWNMQKIGMSWYNLDFTWCIKQEFPRYFNVSNKFLGHRSDSKIKLPVCNTDKQSYLYRNKMQADSIEEVQNCFRSQIKKGKICILNKRIAPQDMLTICQRWLLEYEKEVKLKILIKNIQAMNGSQIVFNVIKDPAYSSYQKMPRVYANVVHVLFIQGDSNSLMTQSEIKYCKSLLQCKKQVKVQIITNNKNKEVFEEIQRMIYECSFNIKKYITANKVAFSGGDVILFELGLDQTIRVLQTKNAIAKGQKCFMKMYGKNYKTVLGDKRVIKFLQKGEYCLFDVIA